ncbi:MAG: hypothetical protein IJ708_03870 [Clostridia bacterium]|nr:hypothetical protein [Clostridia bacterium]
MSIVLQHDSRTNTTYAYHNVVTWIKDEKRSHQKRTLIGRVSPVTGEIIPTAGNRRRNQVDENLIKEEIEAYNQKVKARNQPSMSVERLENDSSQQIQNSNSKENEQLRKALLDFAKAILDIYEEK